MKSKEYEKTEKTVIEESVNVKLPKLIITKLDSTSLDWFRFWNQFKGKIGKAETGPGSKFSYLKNLFIPRVRFLIDGLPFTSEGYSRAKYYLPIKSLYYLVTEIAVAHIQCIISLPAIRNSYPNQMHDISEKLMISVQAHGTLNKLKEIGKVDLRYVAGIRTDLVRLDEDWEECAFPQLVYALRKWATRYQKIIPSPEKGFRC